MGVPGLPPSSVGVKAEIESLQKGIASLYPDINGLPALKEEASRFIKAFVNVDVAPEGCVPVTGPCRELLPLSLHAANVTRKKTQSCLSTPVFPYKSNNWL